MNVFNTGVEVQLCQSIPHCYILMLQLLLLFVSCLCVCGLESVDGVGCNCPCMLPLQCVWCGAMLAQPCLVFSNGAVVWYIVSACTTKADTMLTRSAAGACATQSVWRCGFDSTGKAAAAGCSSNLDGAAYIHACGCRTWFVYAPSAQASSVCWWPCVA